MKTAPRVTGKAVRQALVQAGFRASLVRRGLGMGGFSVPGGDTATGAVSVFWRSPDTTLPEHQAKETEDMILLFADALLRSGYELTWDKRRVLVTGGAA